MLLNFLMRNSSTGIIPFLMLIFIVGLTISNINAEKNIRFSRLLNERPDFLKFTSIARDSKATTELSSIIPSSDSSRQISSQGLRFQNVYRRTSVKPTLTSIRTTTTTTVPPPLPEDDYTVEEYYEEEDSNETTPFTPAEALHQRQTVTSLNRKPISDRVQVTTLQQKTSKGLNISPIFSSSTFNNASLNIPNEDLDAITEIPEEYLHSEEEAATTMANLELNVTRSNDSPLVQPSNASIPSSNLRVGVTLFDNRTNPDPVYSTTPINIDLVKENLVAESFHGPSHSIKSSTLEFPDFEDSPVRLTESGNTPARVNVRPASSGKDYEYEYIYYYYDDDEDEVNASSTTTTTPPPPVPRQRFHQPTSFHEPPSNSLREGKLSPPPEIISIRNPNVVEAGGLQPEIPPINPNLDRQPVLIKNSNIPQQRHENFPFIPRGPSFEPSTSTLSPFVRSTSEKPAIITEPPSLRTVPVENKLRVLGSNARNQFQPETKISFNDGNTAHLPSVPPTRPLSSYESENLGMELQRAPEQRHFPARNPGRRPVSVVPSETSPFIREKDERRYTIPATRVIQQQRLNTEEHHNVPTEASFEPTRRTQHSLNDPSPTVSEESKRRDAYARQKSVTDLYALSRLHQLAISTSIPDRKQESDTRTRFPARGPPISTASETSTDYPDLTMVSESTTISSYLPTLEDVQKAGIPLTTTNAPALALPTKPGRFPFRDRRLQRLRGRPTVSTSEIPVENLPTSTTTPRSYQHNRFATRGRPGAGGRRRFFTTSTTTSTPVNPDAEIEPIKEEEEVKQDSPPKRGRLPFGHGGRRRFGGRTRPTPRSYSTSTTSAPNALTTSAGTLEADEEISNKKFIPKARLRGRRPGPFHGHRRRLLTSTTTEIPSENAEESIQLSSPNPIKPGRVNIQPRRHLLRGKTTTTTTVGTTSSTSTEFPIESELITMEDKEPASDTTGTDAFHGGSNADDTLSTISTFVAPIEEISSPPPQPNIEPKVSVLTSTRTSESSSEAIPRRGSAAVLGRLRSGRLGARLNPLTSTTTTSSPVQQDHSRKPSRLAGILNRRKHVTTVTSSTSTESSINFKNGKPDEIPEGIPPEGVIVQVSSVITESQETGDAEEEVHHSTSTQSSILNRLKSNSRNRLPFIKKRPTVVS